MTGTEILSLDELRDLRRTSPQRLFNYLLEIEREFIFGVEDHREEDLEGWGGELRVVINRNVVVHFVPRLNEAMTCTEELPQFTVLPDERRADSCLETSLVLEEEVVKGVIFYVDPQDYDGLVADALRVVERYEDWDLLPDSYFLGTELISFLNRVVLDHSVVRTEREFDFRQGLVGGEGPPPLDDLDDETGELALGQGNEDEDEDEEDDLFRGHFRTLR
jgi:hypothetical protein